MLQNIEWGVKGLLLCWTGPPPGVPGIRKAVKKQVGDAYIRCEQNFSLLFSIVISLLLLVQFYVCCIVNPKAMNTVAHLGPHLQCRSSTKSTLFIIA